MHLHQPLPQLPPPLTVRDLYALRLPQPLRSQHSRWCSWPLHSALRWQFHPVQHLINNRGAVEISPLNPMDNFGTSERLRRALILKTGQTTSYVTGDDGDLEKGEPHRYYVLSTGQHSGTTNITLGTKSEAHSNACVLDETTSLMRSQQFQPVLGLTQTGHYPGL